MKIALVTYSKSPKLIDGDNLLFKPFSEHGLEIEVIPWDKSNINWNNFNSVILRSCWDYHYRIKEFSIWLDKLENNSVNLWNKINIVRWNINKKYLLDLEENGIPIIPTSIFSQNNINHVNDYLKTLDCEEVILKPTFGASAYKVIKLNKDNLLTNSAVLNEMLQSSEIMIQPYMKEVEQEGEYSFIFFNKKYSHAVIKKPKKDEFRTQPNFGGTEEKIIPDNSLIKQAKQVLNKINSPLLYARVDGINVKGKLMLMELELTEPYLFFEQDNNSAERFVKAVEEITL